MLMELFLFLLLLLTQHTSGVYHELSSTIAAGIINAAHHVVMVSKPDTLNTVRPSLQYLVVQSSEHLDSFGVMETVIKKIMIVFFFFSFLNTVFILF